MADLAALTVDERLTCDFLPSSILFSATGISDSSLLRGVRVEGKIARTHSVLMRVKSRTVRSIKAAHDLSAKTFRLRSANAEVLLVD